MVTQILGVKIPQSEADPNTEKAESNPTGLAATHQCKLQRSSLSGSTGYREAPELPREGVWNLGTLKTIQSKIAHSHR
jgi:hypothetical protein